MKAFLTLLLIFLTYEFNINSTIDVDIIVKELNALIGSPSNLYPKNSFLMKILYGHSSVPFSLLDMNNSFRQFTRSPERAAIIIGRDGKQSGIFIDKSNFVYVNPVSTVEKHPISDINQIFPNGYDLKSSYYIPLPSPMLVSKKTINSADFCSNCDTYFLFDINANTFDENKFWMVYFFSNDLIYSWTFAGYLKSYDRNYNKGIINLVFYDFRNENTQQGYSGFLDNTNAIMNFTTNVNTLSFQIFSNVSVPSISSVYVNGQWSYS